MSQDEKQANRQSAIGNRRVSLFVTCLVDQLWASVGTSAVEVLRRVGCEVDFDARQTCCGQPAFNTGYRKEARQVAEQFIEVFEEKSDQPIVSPSGSCTAMVHHFPELFLILQMLVRCADFAEWIHLVDDRFDFFPKNKLQHLMQIAQGSHK